MAAKGPIDTGAILAFLDQEDRWHERCVQALSHLHFPLPHLPQCLRSCFSCFATIDFRKATAWDFVRSAAVTVLAIDEADLPALEALMRTSADRPMDFADATLVRLAEGERLSTILTVDHDDFET